MTEKVENRGCKSTSIGQPFLSEVFHHKLIKFEGLEAWEYQNGVQLDVPNSLVYSKVEKVIKTLRRSNAVIPDVMYIKG